MNMTVLGNFSALQILVIGNEKICTAAIFVSRGTTKTCLPAEAGVARILVASIADFTRIGYE